MKEHTIFSEAKSLVYFRNNYVLHFVFGGFSNDNSILNSIHTGNTGRLFFYWTSFMDCHIGLISPFFMSSLKNFGLCFSLQERNFLIFINKIQVHARRIWFS